MEAHEVGRDYTNIIYLKGFQCSCNSRDKRQKSISALEGFVVPESPGLSHPTSGAIG